MNEARLKTSRNMQWTPRPGWVTVRLVGMCADRSLRRGQVVAHTLLDGGPDPMPGAFGMEEELLSGQSVIVLSEATHLIEDDLHLVPETAVVAVGNPLP
ncbi:MAG: hypothetical protein EA352_03190 [Gemmatimonadales bacterium]|nr:MAG: hypothetical protein EA352_03190 [Gemmatimonadales bacterium]